jgi:hypothetical protein
MSILNATTNGLNITSDNTGVLSFQTSSANTFVINASGAIGVGTTPSYGTSGQALISNGSGAPPNWGTGGIPLTKVTAIAVVFY